MPVRPLLLHRMALVSFRLYVSEKFFEFFWANGLPPPPLAKNFPYVYVLKQVSVERSSTVICLPSRTDINELKFRSVGFSGEGKPECQEKNLVEEGREPTTNSTHLWSRRRDLNRIWAGGGKFSHFLAPFHPKMNFFYSLLEASHYIIWLEAN